MTKKIHMVDDDVCRELMRECTGGGQVTPSSSCTRPACVLMRRAVKAGFAEPLPLAASAPAASVASLAAGVNARPSMEQGPPQLSLMRSAVAFAAGGREEAVFLTFTLLRDKSDGLVDRGLSQQNSRPSTNVSTSSPH